LIEARLHLDAEFLHQSLCVGGQRHKDRVRRITQGQVELAQAIERLDRPVDIRRRRSTPKRDRVGPQP
jgi:hypothetical protein